MAELIKAVGDERVNPRFVRFLIAEGAIPGPSGGRANAEYEERHADGIRRYLSMRDLGLSAERTKEIVAGFVAGEIPVPIAPGLTLLIHPSRLSQVPNTKAVAAEITRAIQLIKGKDD
jgi:hypothetical protein